ncbi:MAG: AAA family ATPase [Thermoplasmata archaeon]
MIDEPSPTGVAAAPAGAANGSVDPVELFHQLTAAIGREIVGYQDVIRALMIALVSEGHILLEGVPGLAKTHLVRAFSQTLQLSFRRVQFTPDMLPSDILGTTILRPKDQSFEFRPGPIFANVILADEINRAPPKVQSALLEAMQERQVTLDGVSHPLPSPFLVIATQNPLEHEGTYPLPEAELDRFLFRWLMDYPTAENEVGILKTRSRTPEEQRAPAVLSPQDVDRVRALHAAVYVHDDIYAYLARVVRQTRVDRRLLLGASPRASVQFLMAAKAAALLDGRSYVLPDDVRELAFPVFNHRVIVRPEVIGRTAGSLGASGTIGQITQILAEDLDAVDVPH